MKPTQEHSEAKFSPESWTPLLELATREVFEIMLGTQLSAWDHADPVASEFTAMVGLAGQLCGVLTLRSRAASASRMASMMLGMELNHADEQTWDAVGEIANMIAGNFKNKLSGMGDGCMLSVPTVITGTDYCCRPLSDVAPLEVTLGFEGAPIHVELEVHS